MSIKATKTTNADCEMCPVARWRHIPRLSGRLPDYWTQGVSFEDLKDHLADLYQDLTSGEIFGVRSHANYRIPS